MNDLVSTSKFLSLVLRHRPEVIGLSLDEAGWADIDTLIRLSQAHKPLTRALIEQVVEENSKQRFAISDDGRRIRANQGHSIEIELGLQPLAPPRLLYHGTATRFVEAIRREGLAKRSRQHVHLSADADTATAVGARHGQPAVLIVRAGEMAAAGHALFRSENGVWLTDAVPVEFIDFSGE
ncbi:MAG: RNA 2'-phosphotransferase [Xanthomonadales bacterium]|nr:RNA 2'-phosphotransferase [Xanthomonadales bacterium]